MKAIIQRARDSKISSNSSPFESISHGLVVFVGFSKSDKESAIDKLVNKILNLRIFEDENEKLNLNISQVNGEILIVPNFTIYASSVHGNRPSFDDCLCHEQASILYDKFIQKVKQNFANKVVSGVFRSDMQVIVHNDGPINILMEYFE